MALLLAVLLAPLAMPAAARADTRPFQTLLYDDISTLDPFAFHDTTTVSVLRNLYDGLTAVQPDGRIAPALALSWEPLDGARGWRFHLRPGVRFHSGRPFTAADVKWTFERLLAPGRPVSLGGLYLRSVAGATAFTAGQAAEVTGLIVVDPLTIDIRFPEPDALFPLYPFMIVDSGMAADLGPDWPARASGGTGPFRFGAWAPGVAIDLTAFPQTWHGAPAVTGLHYAIVPDAATALALYDSGAIDAMPLVDSLARATLADPRYDDQLFTTPRSQVRYLGLNQTAYPPFHDPRVRQALSLAIDRPALIDRLYHGRATALNGPVAPLAGGYQSQPPQSPLPPLTYDPDRARTLLAEAGYPGGRGLPPVSLAGLESWRQEMAYYAAQFHSLLGLDVTLQFFDRGSFFQAMNQARLPFFLGGWTADYPDPLNFLEPMWHSHSPFNRLRWANDAFDRLIDRARTLVDDQQRFALYAEAETVVMQDLPAIPLPVPFAVALIRPGVHGLVVTPDGMPWFGSIALP